MNSSFLEPRANPDDINVDNNINRFITDDARNFELNEDDRMMSQELIYKNQLPSH